MPKPKPLDAHTLLQFTRIGAIALSPDGTQAVCTLSETVLDQNRLHSTLWRLPTDGGEPRPLTTCGTQDSAPAFSPDGRMIAFTALREQQGEKDLSPQLYLIDTQGGEARRVSRHAPGIGAFRWLPNGQQLVFVAWVWPELRSAAAQNRRQAEWLKRRESGLVTQEAQYRYWNTTLPPGRVAHLHLLDLATGRITDLMAGTPYELPREEPGLACFDVHPDGRQIVFCHDPEPVKVGGQRCELLTLTLRGRRINRLAHHTRWDFTAPRFNPQGTQIAAIATPVQRRDTPFGHASFGRLAVWPTDRAFRPADARAWDHDPQAPLHWESDGQALWCLAEARGRCHAWRHRLVDRQFHRAVEGGWVQGLAIAGAGGPGDAGGGASVLTVRDSLAHPARAFLRRGGTEQRLERFNDGLLQQVRLGRVEEHEVTGAQGDALQLWVIYPPDPLAERGRRRPARRAALQVVHGGPYTAAGDSFSYRWNPHLLAAGGQVVVQANYHGSSGFGEAFRTSILGRQGDLELQDLRAATDWILRQPWADPARVYAAGASYGGFLVAWMNAHWRPWPAGPIRAYVCHAGVFDRRATWSADSYSQRHRDLGGTYWQAPERVAGQSPVSFAARMDTPTFVIHGAQDFRVPDHNGLAYYNTLKARGVDARLLWFPDEGHWVQKPHNVLQWYAQVADWLQRHQAGGRVLATAEIGLR